MLLPIHIPENSRSEEIDRIKLFAIFFVILLHSISHELLYKIFAQYHIWHAVPIFMLVAGITSSFSESKISGHVIETQIKIISKRILKILIPFTIVYFLQIAYMGLILGDDFPNGFKLFKNWFCGGFGPGSYFIPVFIQHLLIFPIISKVNCYFKHKQLIYCLVFWFITSMTIDYLCLALDMPQWLYRLFYGRYLFAVVLGTLVYKETPPKLIIYFTLTVSIAYIIAVTQLQWLPSILYPSWILHKPPAYFYSLAILIGIWNAPKFICMLLKPILFFGKASYHIFLIQMFYFWKFQSIVNNIFQNLMLTIVLHVIICFSLGTFFYIIHKLIWTDFLVSKCTK